MTSIRSRHNRISRTREGRGSAAVTTQADLSANLEERDLEFSLVPAQIAAPQILRSPEDEVDEALPSFLTMKAPINKHAEFLLRQTRGRFLVEFDLLNKKGSQLVVNLLRAQRMLKKPSP